MGTQHDPVLSFYAVVILSRDRTSSCIDPAAPEAGLPEAFTTGHMTGTCLTVWK